MTLSLNEADDMLTAKQAGNILGVSPRSVYDLPIQRTQYSPRRIRWARSDVEEYKAKCRSTSTRIKNAGASISRVVLMGSVTELQNSFRQAGAAIKPKPMTGRSARVFTLKHIEKPRLPLAGKITKAQAVSWLHQHAEDANRSLRDDFAAAALTGIMATLSDPQEQGSHDEHRKGQGPDHAAHACYNVADAMLNERIK